MASSLTRRSFLQTSSAAAAAAVLAPGARAAVAGESEETRPAQPSTGFPESFCWSASTAAYQVEGAAAEDGRKPSIWDTFSRIPGKVVNGDTGDVACDHYHRYVDDVKLLAELGVKHYRFSIAWPRVIPDGRGAVNEKGVDFYRRLCDQLHQHGITPHATLYHWDLPQALQDRYAGWESPEVAKDFANYASAVVTRLGDRVQHWLTLNEIRTFVGQAGYNFGRSAPHAPGITLKTKQAHRQVVHHALLAHGLGCQAIRAASPVKCSVGLAENYSPMVPVIETPEHIAATRKAFANDEFNGAIIMPILTGRYADEWLASRRDSAPRFTDAEMKIIRQPLDVLGFNCYNGSYVAAADNAAGYTIADGNPEYPKMNIFWLTIVPESIYWGVRMISEAAGKPKLPILITENGCPDGSEPSAGGTLVDTDRIMYLRSYLRNVQRAVAEGYPLIGYSPWSLMDNYEWAEGYAKRFGLMHVDYATQRRTPKMSYRWYQTVIRERRVV